MVEHSFTQERVLIFFVQTKNPETVTLLADAVKEENLPLRTIEHSTQLKEYESNDRIVAFIIDDDVDDPIQSAQRLHVVNKKAVVIILAKPQRIESLKSAVRFSPFIGTEVVCLNKSQKGVGQKVRKILNDSVQAVRYRDIIAQSNTQISSKASIRKSVFSQSFINKLMDIAPIGIAIVSRKGKILGWNKKAVSIFNRNEAEVLGSSMSKFFEPQEGNKLNRYLKKNLRIHKGNAVEPLTIERNSTETGMQVLNVTAASFFYSSGTGRALILAIKDVTENVKLIKQLKTEVMARDNFLSMASHELRTPLTVMRINLDLLRNTLSKGVSSPSELLKLGQKSLRQADQLNNLIKDLFDVGKIHSGKLDFKLEEVNLSQIVKDYIEDTEEKFEQVHSEVVLDIEPDVIGVWDKNRILQAFNNLIDNAVKYAPGTVVKVTLKTAGNQAYLSVEDKGTGIEKKKRAVIFNRFERGTGTDTISGLGLGLFITKKIIEGHGGDIQLRSTTGKGSVFTLKLPLNLDPEQPDADLGIFW